MKTAEVKGEGYEWYELPAWIPQTGDRMWFAAGQFKPGQSPAVKDVWIDAIEILRAD